MIINFLNVIKIEVDENYKWKDNIFIDKNISNMYEQTKIKQKIKIKYLKKIDYSKTREIEKDIYCCDEYFYDANKGVKIYFETKDCCVIETNQECNEWLVIMLQIMLLKNNLSFIHAAAIEKEQNGYLLPSWGGVGKTACVAKLLKNGYKLLGDDLNIINIKGKILGFPKKFVLYFYHKELFPKVFEKYSVKCNSIFNKFYNKIIPNVKKVLRKTPSILAFARRHNPQSIKVSPFEIFSKDDIVKEANIKQIVWLERNIANNEYKDEESLKIASKAIAVTLNELFGDNVNAILIMCGFNIIDYNEIFIRMNDIYKEAFNVKNVGTLNVDKRLNVSEVPKELMKIIK